MRTLRRLTLIFCIGLVSAVLMFAFLVYYYEAPGPLAEPKTVLFKRGMGFEEIVDNMATEGIIQYPLVFKAVAVAIGSARQFKAGEYEFTTAITPKLIMDMIAEGRVVVHKLTVPEGLNVREITALLNNEKLLDGEVSPHLAEGSLLPQTYHFTYGDSRSTLIERMHTGMKQTIDELWEKRKSGLPFKTKEEAVILASIIEKETGVVEERGRVASVFINRLRKGMKLQTDPTVAYGIEKETGAPLGRMLVMSDLKNPTAYNTYVIDGLPPGPIANPGRASIEATLNPPDTDYLYFVATGSGGHNFSQSFKGHSENVKSYREKKKTDKADKEAAEKAAKEAAKAAKEAEKAAKEAAKEAAKVPPKLSPGPGFVAP